MNANPAEQRTLLRIQDLDSRTAQIARLLKSLPQDAQLAELRAADETRLRERAEAQGVLDDARAELRRIETDVEMVEARILRDTQREAGSASAKDVTALELEIDSLRRRKSELEDAELVVMERVEQAEAALAEIDARAEQRAEARLALEAERTEAQAALEREAGEAASDHRALAATIAADLLALYEQRRDRNAGVGAGLLRQRTCGACAMVLTGADLDRIRSLPDDALVQCPECESILVRTEESGLA